MVGKILMKRTIARISVSAVGLAIVGFCFFKLVTAPFFPYPEQQLINVVYLALLIIGAFFLYWAAWTNFSKDML